MVDNRIKKLAEKFIREFKDRVDWYWVSGYQTLSEEFIREMKDYVDWSGVSLCQRLSENFIREFKDRVDWYYFEAGMDAMMETLEPKVVLVYSTMPDAIEEKYPKTKFVEYPDWASLMRRGK